MKLNLKMKILVPTIILIIIVMGISTAITYFLASKSLKENATEGLSMMADSKAELIDRWVEDFKGLIQASATREEFRTLLKEDNESHRNPANRSLAEQVKIASDVSYINIANVQGEVRASSMPDAVGKVKVADREYFQKALKGEVNVSDAYLARTTGKPAFAVAAPVRDGEKIIGVIVGVPDLTKFSERFIDQARVLQTGYIVIADSSGAVLAHRDKSLIMKMNLKEHDFGREMLALKQGQLVYRIQGQENMGSLQTCKAVNWMLIASAPYREVVGDANAMAYYNMVLLAVGLILIIALLYIIASSITRPINRVMEGLREGAEQMTAGASQVSSASQQLAEGASEQAAAIEETSSSLEEMSSMTRHSAENAESANTAMSEVSKVVASGHSSMAELNNSMEEISKASEETQKIIKTIDEIAFQTNLLALNAAVEAARAGEAGAGFAVVADEVRNLALRAAEAAKNTAGLIETTVQKVRGGAEIAENALGIFNDVNKSSCKVGDLVGEITAASREQAQGIEQINKAVAEMDKVIQKNAANAEESASASEEMNAQAEQMKAYIYELGVIVGGGNSRRKA